MPKCPGCLVAYAAVIWAIAGPVPPRDSYAGPERATRNSRRPRLLSRRKSQAASLPRGQRTLGWILRSCHSLRREWGTGGCASVMEREGCSAPGGRTGLVAAAGEDPKPLRALARSEWKSSRNSRRLRRLAMDGAARRRNVPMWGTGRARRGLQPRDLPGLAPVGCRAGQAPAGHHEPARRTSPLSRQAHLNRTRRLHWSSGRSQVPP